MVNVIIGLSALLKVLAPVILFGWLIWFGVKSFWEEHHGKQY